MMHLVLALALVSTPGAHGQSPESESRAQDYQRSCTSLEAIGFAATSTGTAEYLVDGDGNEVLVRWGSQVGPTSRINSVISNITSMGS